MKNWWKSQGEINKILIIGSVALIIVISIAISTTKHSSPSKIYIPKKARYTDQQALIQSYEFVKQNLKSPSTAEFGSQGTITKLNDTTFIVINTVDSQNSFGAMLRSNYSIKIIFLPNNMVIYEKLIWL